MARFSSHLSNLSDLRFDEIKPTVVFKMGGVCCFNPVKFALPSKVSTKTTPSREKNKILATSKNNSVHTYVRLWEILGNVN